MILMLQIGQNIPKFSKLDDILTPVRLLELFSDDALVNMIVGHTKLYTQREKADIRFEITNQKIRLFLGMLLLREAGQGGAITLQAVNLIGRRPLILLQEQGLLWCLAMYSSVFFGISIFVTTNNFINKTNSGNSLKLSFNRQTKSIVWFSATKLMAIGNE